MLIGRNEILESLSTVIEGSAVENDKIIVKDLKATIDVKLTNMIDNKDNVIAEMVFILNQEKLQDPIVEVLAGYGPDPMKAVSDACVNFILGAFDAVRNFVKKEIYTSFESDFLGEKRSFEVTESSLQQRGVLKKGSIRPYIWMMIEDEIKKKFGAEKTYYVKIFTSRVRNEKITCECSINGVNDKVVEAQIKEWTSGWKMESDFASIKQYFIVEQKSETYREYPISYEKLEEDVDKFIDVIENCDSEIKFKKMYDGFEDIIQNENIAFEIRSFVPEILTDLVFKEVGLSNKLIILKGDSNIKTYFTQYQSYFDIKGILIKKVNDRSIKDLTLRKIIALSGLYKAISKALKDGKELKDIKNVIVGFKADNSYIPC
ncbi:DUF6348 family protein [Clostridium sp. BJN0001]|uniref:DUF6348 family protein n=1 Tax=Clostridium sp. BJN0001 TaxID=2930219 RepID=UPI001FD4BBD7|nr:DUF6348 family protein [Clostridium sp. BJN0001]